MVPEHYRELLDGEDGGNGKPVGEFGSFDAVDRFLSESTNREAERLEQLARIDEQLEKRDAVHEDIVADLEEQIEAKEEEIEFLWKENFYRSEDRWSAKQELKQQLEQLRTKLRRGKRRRWESRQELLQERRELQRELDELTDTELVKKYLNQG